MRIVYSIFLVVSIFFSWSLKGQDGFLSSTKMITKTGFNLSTSSLTPYLNKTNQYGLVPLEGQTYFFNVDIHQEFDSTYKKNKRIQSWGYSYGLEMHTNLGEISNLLFPVAYVSGRYKGVELYVGRKREYLGLADTSGTWGSYIWSGNSLPIPKMQISTPHYLPLAGKGFLSFKVGLSHGWFGKQQFTEGYYIHQKWLYLKLGRDSQKVNIIGGINHNAQWGGYSEILKNDTYASRNGYFAADAFAYLNVVLPLKVWKRPDNRYSPYEMEYRFGNHLGTIDLGFSIKTGNGLVGLYRQTPWEDGQAPEVFFSGDGNYTLVYQIKEKASFQKVGIEFLNTRRQAYELSGLAKFIGLKEKHPGEVQNYMNHGQYLEGWSYQGRGLGSSAIVPYRDLSQRVKGGDFSQFTKDNAVIAPAVNIVSKIKKVRYSLHAGYIVSSGLVRNKRTERVSQFSVQLSGVFPISKYNAFGKIDLGWDNGDLYGNHTGVNLTLSKRWR